MQISTSSGAPSSSPMAHSDQESSGELFNDDEKLHPKNMFRLHLLDVGQDFILMRIHSTFCLLTMDFHIKIHLDIHKNFPMCLNSSNSRMFS